MRTNVNVDVSITLCIEVEHGEDASNEQIIEEGRRIAESRPLGSNVDVVDRQWQGEIAQDTGRD